MVLLSLYLVKVWIYNRNRKKKKGGEGQMKREQSTCVLKSHSLSTEGRAYFRHRGRVFIVSRQGSSELREMSLDGSDWVLRIGQTALANQNQAKTLWWI